MAEYHVFPELGVVAKPESLSFNEASTLPCAAVTAWNALYGLVPLQAGQVVLCQGTGGVSTFALQFAVAAGAEVIVTSSSDSKLEWAKRLGASHTINYRNTPAWEKEAKRLTGGRGADQVIEIGGHATLEQSLDAINLHGQINCIGHITNPGQSRQTSLPKPTTENADPLGEGQKLKMHDIAFLALDKLAIIRGVVVGSREQFEEMNRLIDLKGIRPVVSKTYSFEQVREAYDDLWTASHVGKIVIEIVTS